MVEYKISGRAYTKIILHVAKYPHLAVNGVLLAGKEKDDGADAGSGDVQILDAIPLFHQCLYVTPMAEIALMQVEAYADINNMVIAGYYAAAENFYDNTIDKMPGIKIADKIQEHYKNACTVIVDNKLVTLRHDRSALKVFTCTSGDNVRWSKASANLDNAQETLSTVGALLKRGATRDIADFDNHLDNPANDWTNAFLNKDLNQLLAMY